MDKKIYFATLARKAHMISTWLIITSLFYCGTSFAMFMAHEPASASIISLIAAGIMQIAARYFSRQERFWKNMLREEIMKENDAEQQSHAAK